MTSAALTILKVGDTAIALPWYIAAPGIFFGACIVAAVAVAGSA